MAAGLMIGIGCCIYISAENKVVGATLFTLGLFAVCVFGLNLFTGKIGYVISTRNDPNIIFIWLGNLVGTVATAILCRIARPELAEVGKELCDKKLDIAPLSAVILGFFCGIIMYIAVDNYKHNPDGFGRYLGMLLGVPLFILAGFEHSIADMFYITFGIDSVSEIIPAVVFILVVTLGNALGAICVHYLFGVARKKA